MEKNLDETGWINAVEEVPTESGRIMIRTLYEIEGDFVVTPDGEKSFKQDNSTAKNVGILSWKKVEKEGSKDNSIDKTH